MERTCIAITSSDKDAVMHLEIYTPEDKSNLKGMIQICHGMTEYVWRYKSFAEYFTSRGYVVFGNDIISHGRSNTQKSLGLYFTDWRNVYDDAEKAREYVQEKYPGLPVYILGFSLGSYAVRTMGSLLPYKKEILIGTGDQQEMLMKLMQKKISKKYAGKMAYISDDIKELLFGSYAKKFPGKPENYWLLTDDEKRSEYEEDRLAGFVGTFMVMIFTLNDDDKLVRRLLVSRLCLQVVADWIFISSFKDVGAAYAEIAVNAVIGLIAVLSAYSKGYLKFAMPGKTFLKDWCKIGAFAGIQIFLDNFIYAVMVCKMVNAVSESGNYWVANNFIWGWLLVPVTCLVEVIKKNDKIRLTMKNCWRYLIMIFAVWLITMPRWKSFISGPMASDGNVIMKIVLPLVPFYITYMISAVIDGWFVSHGRTIYNAINSLIVNVGYYGIIYLAFKRGMFAENIMFIIGMFGCGMLVHMAASILMYRLEIIRTQTMPADCQKKAV